MVLFHLYRQCWLWSIAVLSVVKLYTTNMRGAYEKTHVCWHCFLFRSWYIYIYFSCFFLHLLLFRNHFAMIVEEKETLLKNVSSLPLGKGATNCRFKRVKQYHDMLLPPSPLGSEDHEYWQGDLNFNSHYHVTESKKIGKILFLPLN